MLRLMKLQIATVIDHREMGGEYRILTLAAPSIASRINPGQFVHVRVPRLETAVLRRPFSVFRVNGRKLSIIYKLVGRGTRALASVEPGEDISVMGPLGNGFPAAGAGSTPLLVAGGYGVAPLYFLASRMRRKGAAFIGGAEAKDILCAGDFRKIGWKVRIATEDGSAGARGLVTDILDRWLERRKASGIPEFFACGPDGMLKAVGNRAIAGGWKAWLSLDKHMGCGVGACLACVQKIRMKDGTEGWMRVCREGPVFEARQIVWE